MGTSRALALIATHAALGCASYGAHLTATPVPEGEHEWMVAADAVLLDRGFGPQVLPNPEVGLRFGLGQDIDVGGRLNSGGLELNSVMRVVDTGTLDLALVPGVAVAFVPATNPDTGVMQASALGSLLLGLHLSPRVELVFGARAVAAYAFPLTALRGDASSSKMIYSPGASSGVRVRLSRTLSLMPEVNALVPYDSARRAWSFPSVQAGISLHIE